ncbi:hypothetical protein ATCV1_z793R [Acanthocystis turfacea chlorella virus 1]|uniref:Uncharacterized protein z793R n=1 Tax=Chlorovirus heliozoae TaxID=322019 RepID=A7KA53_9PHYC|nr:hypothetical protein ATCV1_z793R [Acanthocystis turfacea chlorella virus 1]ABT16927.1 hypothetical protein ATCV1_z793R [Acanthocystis turfacea chlorella virus 1]
MCLTPSALVLTSTVGTSSRRPRGPSLLKTPTSLTTALLARISMLLNLHVNILHITKHASYRISAFSVAFSYSWHVSSSQPGRTFALQSRLVGHIFALQSLLVGRLSASSQPGHVVSTQPGHAVSSVAWSSASRAPLPVRWVSWGSGSSHSSGAQGVSMAQVSGTWVSGSLMVRGVSEAMQGVPKAMQGVQKEILKCFLFVVPVSLFRPQVSASSPLLLRGFAVSFVRHG